MDILSMKKILVLGLGESGRAVSSLLAGKGFDVIVTDDDDDKVQNYSESIMSLESSKVKGVSIKEAFERLKEIECLVISPGVALSHPLVSKAGDSSVELAGELEIAYQFCSSKIIAVTGTNGKSTVTDLIGKIVEAAGIDCVVAGNIGTPLSSVVSGEHIPVIIVLEVSSFQLDTIDRFKADIAVILNVTPDHLDRYDDSIDKYALSKKRITNGAGKESFLVYNEEDAWCRSFADDFPGSKIPFCSRHSLERGIYLDQETFIRRWEGEITTFIKRGEFFPIGLHNVENALAAIGAVTPLEIESDIIGESMKRYRPLPHRMELVRVSGGVAYINDSKATNVDATSRSLESIEGNVILIMGGRDKNGNFEALRTKMGKVKKAVLIGEAAERIETAIRDCCPIEIATGLREAVEVAEKTAVAGDTVLLAPACASFDMFHDYKERGMIFKEIVKEI